MCQRSQVVLNNREGRRLESIYSCRVNPRCTTYANSTRYAYINLSQDTMGPVRVVPGSRALCSYQKRVRESYNHYDH